MRFALFILLSLGLLSYCTSGDRKAQTTTPQFFLKKASVLKIDSFRIYPVFLKPAGSATDFQKLSHLVEVTDNVDGTTYREYGYLLNRSSRKVFLPPASIFTDSHKNGIAFNTTGTPVPSHQIEKIKYISTYLTLNDVLQDSALLFHTSPILFHLSSDADTYKASSWLQKSLRRWEFQTGEDLGIVYLEPDNQEPREATISWDSFVRQLDLPSDWKGAAGYFLVYHDRFLLGQLYTDPDYFHSIWPLFRRSLYLTYLTIEDWDGLQDLRTFHSPDEELQKVQKLLTLPEEVESPRIDRSFDGHRLLHATWF